MFAGHVIVGFCASTTVTVNVHDDIPQVFVAVKVTVVTPTLNVEPLPLPDPLPVVTPVNV